MNNNDTTITINTDKEETVKDNKTTEKNDVIIAVETVTEEETTENDIDKIMEILNSCNISDNTNKENIKDKKESETNTKVNDTNEENTEEKKAKSFIKGLLDFLTNPNFEKKIVEESQKNGLQPRKVAKTFITKCLGTISDVLHLTLDTIHDAFSTLISILAGLLIKGGDLLIRCAKRLTRIVTLNATCTNTQ